MTTNSNDRYRKGERARRPKETNKFIVHITAKGEAARKRYGDHFSLTKICFDRKAVSAHFGACYKYIETKYTSYRCL